MSRYEFNTDNLTDFASKYFARADFKPELFDNLILQKGMTIVWEQSMFCYCLDGHTGQPDYNCTTCNGKGYIYFDPKTTKAVVTSINGRKENEKTGLEEKGTAYLTPKSTDMVGYRDRFTFPDFVIKFSEVLDLDRYTQTCSLRYEGIDILALLCDGVQYKPGVDFDFTDGKKSIVAINPECYGKCSVLYTTHPRYIAIGPIHELRGTYCMRGAQGGEYFVPLPSQFQIKREDFLDD